MALTEEQAVSVARAYVEANPIPDRAYRYTVKKWHPVAEGWYFPFAYERADGGSLSDDDGLEGTPGYIVASVDGQVRPISWGEWSQRQLGAG